ncbi:ankyrin repeat-containing protein [Anaeramoeba ignava]|uniref:Ankyrin repeat-containing protein n=1 Tax=Anaeramoeba ignava TaxID=1746090 RepID=A0A9Q0LNP3_ANAIG|nr:ankyrin repeat-containing protein [Anaeramoeba ignava]
MGNSNQKNTSFFRENNYESINNFIQKNQNQINQQNGFTFLHFAISAECSKEIFQILLNFNANPNIQNGDDAFMFAIIRNLDFEIFKLLLEKPINFNTKNYHRNIFDVAFQHNSSFELISSLIESRLKTEIETDSSFGDYLISALKTQQTIEVLNILYSNLKEKPSEISEQGNSLLHFACYWNADASFIQKLVNDGVEVNKINDGFTAFHYSIINKSKLEIVQFLLDSNVDINLKAGKTPIHLACQNNSSEEIINLLLESGANPTEETGESPISFACKYGNENVVRKLLEKSEKPIQVPENDNSPLIIASKYPRIIQLLVDSGININFTIFHFGTNKTPLSIINDVESCEILLKNGANPNLGNPTPIFGACTMGHDKKIKLLIQYGAKINSPDGNFPIHSLCSSYFRSLKSLILLIEEGIDLNVENIQTPIEVFRPNSYQTELNYSLVRSFILGGVNLERIPQKLIENEKLQKIKKEFSINYENIQKIYTESILTDFTFQMFGKDYKIHRIFAEARIEGKKVEEAIEFFRNKKCEELESFLSWIYGGFFESKMFNRMKKLLVKFGINKIGRKTGPVGVQTAIEKLYKEEPTKDFTIICENKPIKVHKFVLLLKSELYRGMFLSVNDDSNQVNDYSGKCFETVSTIIQFIYLDCFKSKLSKKIRKEMEDASDYYQLIGSSFDNKLTFI